MPASEAYARYAALFFSQGAGVRDPKFWQLARKAVIAMLDDHLHFAGRNITLEGQAGGRPPLPYGVALALRAALERAADGEVHPLFEPMKSRGGRGNSATYDQRKWRERAVDYLTAVDSGWVDDPRSRATVAERMGVTVRQVQRWVLAGGSLARRRAALEKRYPVRSGQSREAWARNTGRLLQDFVRFYAKFPSSRAPGRRSVSAQSRGKSR